MRHPCLAACAALALVAAPVATTAAAQQAPGQKPKAETGAQVNPRASYAPSGGFARAQAEIVDAQGNTVGTVALIQYQGGVVVHGTLEGLPPGWHGFHIHETGACTPDFKAAGGHYNPGDTGHGFDEPQPHAGDLANIHVTTDGTARFDMITTRVSLGATRTAAVSGEAGETQTGGVAAEAPSVFDADGSAIVIHSGPDDYMTDPAGDSGDRIACGVIEKG